MRRALLALTVAALAVPAVASGAQFELRNVDLSAYPVVRVTVHSPQPSAPPRVYENRQRIGAVEAQNLGESKAIVLALDRSQSMRGRPFAAAVEAAQDFVARKRGSDSVAIVSFGSTALAQTGFAQATIDSDTALRALTVDRREGTALYDAVVLSAARLRAQPLPGRVIVLLTDGDDVRSLATLADAVRAARRAGIVVCAIGLGDLDSAPLRRLTASTGGSYYLSSTPDALGSVYRQIAADLDRTWRVSYTTAARPGDSIDVAVGGPDGRTVAAKEVVVPGEASGSSRSWLPREFVGGIGGAAAISLFVGLLLFLAMLRFRTVPRGARMKILVTAHTALEASSRRRKKRFATLVGSVDRRLRGVHRWASVERLVEQAGLPVNAAFVLLVGAAAGVLLALVALVVSGSALLSLALFVLGIVGPLLAVRIRASRRVRAFDDQLPDALATIAGSLRVGHGLKTALQAVADEGASPARDELRRVLSEARLGRPLEEALIAMCERLGSDDLLYVATAVDVQSQVGGSLAGVFNTVADTVRQRQQHRRKVRALTATGRSAAIVLSLLPVAFVALMTLIDPDYMLPFLRSGFGQTLMIVSAISISIGAVLLNRIVNVKA